MPRPETRTRPMLVLALAAAVLAALFGQRAVTEPTPTVAPVFQSTVR